MANAAKTAAFMGTASLVLEGAMMMVEGGTMEGRRVDEMVRSFYRTGAVAQCGYLQPKSVYSSSPGKRATDRDLDNRERGVLIWSRKITCTYNWSMQAPLARRNFTDAYCFPFILLYRVYRHLLRVLCCIAWTLLDFFTSYPRLPATADTGLDLLLIVA